MNTPTHGSTGPRTPEGKAISSKNALKHGFTSRDLVIPDHLKDEFAQLQSRLLSEITIDTEFENQAFRQYLRASWNLYRLDLEEARLFNEKGVDALLAPEHAHLQRYRRQQERSRSEALKELRRLRQEIEASRADIETGRLQTKIEQLLEEQKVRFAKIENGNWRQFLPKSPKDAA
ncbi:MAG: hypothetical protein K2Q23_12255 [Bryobacteraceae bacterium]|nr:hypothetical protein [Bryobacteraceae bacterium]